MKFLLSFYLVLLLAAIAAAQSGRTAPTPTPAPAESTPTAKELYEEASSYVRVKADEFAQKKVPFSNDRLEILLSQQKALAAHNALRLGGRKTLEKDDLYYLGMLHWLAQDLDGTREILTSYLAAASDDNVKAQTARSILSVVLAKQARPVEAANVLEDYKKHEPSKLSDIARMTAEIAKSFQSAKEFEKMVPFAVAAYETAKSMLDDPSYRQRGLDELLDAGMLVFEAYRDSKNSVEAEKALDDMRLTAAKANSAGFYYYAGDQKIKYLIETGRKPEAMKFYEDIDATINRNLKVVSIREDVRRRFKVRRDQYRILGEKAPEFVGVDVSFPGRQTLASLKGKVVLLDFWAIWCVPCIEAMPDLKEWHEMFSRDGFEIVGITRYYGEPEGLPANKKDELALIKAFREKHKMPYDIPVALDQRNQLAYGATRLPTAVILDRKGVVRFVESGTSPLRLAQIEAAIKKLLEEN
ncbi:MAG TPA: TlpA disulfide reductase family protein [Pyrinomonadaceae bacterium]|nr:TlpA disulfide reductase family protein [Pyrinomonadaceae bacterium]